ncbi:MAG: aldehyde dehydrogenase family protein [Rhodothermaceae bacterium]|nr:aldehyde dehydrogenase family protein [Rhodothermaceae bacterium]
MDHHTEVCAGKIYALQQNYQKSLGGIPVSLRLELLKKLQRLIETNRSKLQNAVNNDLGKSDAEFSISEFTPVIHEINQAKKKIFRWTKPIKAKRSLIYFATKGYIRYEPKGAVLIISPWNFPLNLTLAPLVSAIAAGNSVTIKPSELSPATSGVMAEIINNNFDPHLIYVLTGGAEIAIELQKQPYNHVFFTGSPAIGRKVMKAASEHLASVTLELGGKSPVIIDRGTDIEDAAAKVAAGKFLNCGQTCIAPDYILVHKSDEDNFLKAITAALKKSYYRGTIPVRQNPDYARIINKRHFHRLDSLLNEAIADGALLVTGGERDEESLFFEPTVLSRINMQSAIMTDEIFGPVLPVLTYEDESEVIDIILGRPKPLSLYIFSKREHITARYINRISSGNICINEVLIQFLHPNLPFGGINTSGIGNSHGYYGFKAFSHERAVVKQPLWFSLSRLLSPPFSPFVKRLIHITEKYL